MGDDDWLAANAGNGLDLAEQYIAEAKVQSGPVRAIGKYLLAIDVMRIHLGRLDAVADLARMNFNDPGEAEAPIAADATNAQMAVAKRPMARSM